MGREGYGLRPKNGIELNAENDGYWPIAMAFFAPVLLPPSTVYWHDTDTLETPLPPPLHDPPRRARVRDHDALEGSVVLLVVAEPEPGVVRPQEVGVVDQEVPARVVAQRPQFQHLKVHVAVLRVPVVPEQGITKSF